jgi:lipopolysaccharide assembly protein B
MSSDTTFLLAGLLFLAAALGYLFARYGEERDDDSQAAGGALNADYIKGMNFLLNEQPDQALEVFIRMVEVDNETLETHFALGSLFRRRGEVERAIRVHQNLIARPNLNQEQRDQAFFALAEDYLRAGLYDRAEKIFVDFGANSKRRDAASRKLVRIYEMTHDWEQAIASYEQLEASGAIDGSDQIAHYYCELAEQAQVAGDADTASAMLQRALGRTPVIIRARLLEADTLQQAGDHAAAIDFYTEVIQQEPQLASHVIPRLARSCRASDRSDELTGILSELIAGHPTARDAIALAAIRDQEINNPVALQCLQDYAASHPILAALIDKDQLTAADPVVRNATLQRVRQALRQIASRAARYRCTECGYSTMELLWQCPSCRQWETVVPNEHLGLDAMLGK